jgi:hypothetical protein
MLARPFGFEQVGALGGTYDVRWCLVGLFIRSLSSCYLGAVRDRAAMRWPAGYFPGRDYVWSAVAIMCLNNDLRRLTQSLLPARPVLEHMHPLV